MSVLPNGVARIKRAYLAHDRIDDDGFLDGELAIAGAIYAWPSPRPFAVKVQWPLEEAFAPAVPVPNPRTCGCKSVGECPHFVTVSESAAIDARIRDLSHAGALIAAEIDRLLRRRESLSARSPAARRGGRKK